MMLDFGHSSKLCQVVTIGMRIGLSSPLIILSHFLSHMVSVPPGPHLLSDSIISSPILAEDRGITGGLDGNVPVGAGGSNQDFEFGVDPSLDPELAMVCSSSAITSNGS